MRAVSSPCRRCVGATLTELTSSLRTVRVSAGSPPVRAPPGTVLSAAHERNVATQRSSARTPVRRCVR